MSADWPKAVLNEILQPIERREVIIPGKVYRQIGVKLWGMGAYERESIDGSQTRYKTLSCVEADDVIVNKIWARNGSVAVVTKNLAGCYGSNEFPTFAPISEKIMPRWFHWFTKTAGFWIQCDEKSRGTSGKNRIRPERFLDIEIPLPLLDEQRRVVARIEGLAAKIDEAQKLRRQAAEEAEILWTNSLNGTFVSVNWASTSLEKACDAIIDNLHSTPKYEGDEFPCIRSQDVGWGTINYSTALRTGEEEFIHRTRRGEPKAGDIVYVREGDVGRCAVVDGSQRFSLGQRVMMLRPNPKIIDSQFLIHQLMSPSVLRDQVLIGMTGTTSHHVNIKHLKKVKLRVPPLDEQRRIVAHLDELQAKVDALKKYQAKISEELNALLPSVLDKAFKGEL